MKTPERLPGRTCLLPLFLASLCTGVFTPPSQAGDYAVVVSGQTATNTGWCDVVSELKKKHDATVLIYQDVPEETLPALRKLFPRYACFVARPTEASRQFVARVHRLTREFNDDPYPDCFWGILTGYDASNALRIARCSEPLTIRKGAAGTSMPLEVFEEGRWFSEIEAGLMMKKEKGGKPETIRGEADSTEALVKSLTEYKAELFLTSGHATERDWQPGYSYRNGQFRCEQGVVYGLDLQKRKMPVISPNPKVYLPVGNCLMGHIDSTNAMALAFMNSVGVNQMVGYTVNTWYGYSGWGCLDYFLGQPGRFTLAEAFYANQVALIYRLQTYFPELARAPFDPMKRPTVKVTVGEEARAIGLNQQDGQGLLYDRDVVAFYGDPAWVARMGPGPRAWEQRLSETGNVWTFEIVPQRGEASFSTADNNGSQRGGRPMVELLPERLEKVEVIEGRDLKPIITSRFILIPHPGKCDPARKYVVKFRASKAG